MKSTTINVDEDVKPKIVVGKRPLELFLIDAILWILMTCYMVAVVVLGSTGKDGFPLLVVVYLFISLRLLARHVSISQTVYGPMGRAFDKLPKPTSRKTTTIVLFVLTIAGLLIGAFTFQSSGNSTLGSRLQSITGIFCLIGSGRLNI
jgi:concentrative nucleoside transporter, CNT family